MSGAASGHHRSEKAKVRPARISVSGAPSTEAWRTARSNPSPSLTSQITPTSAAKDLGLPEFAFVDELRHGTNGPGGRTFDDRAQEHLAAIVAR